MDKKYAESDLQQIERTTLISLFMELQQQCATQQEQLEQINQKMDLRWNSCVSHNNSDLVVLPKNNRIQNKWNGVLTKQR